MKSKSYSLSRDQIAYSDEGMALLKQGNSRVEYGGLNEFDDMLLERQFSEDEYEATLPQARHRSLAHRTGRQRRKNVARSKGQKPGPTQSKRRVSVSRIGDEIDIEKLFDNIESAQYKDWSRSMYGGEVIRLFKAGAPPSVSSLEKAGNRSGGELKDLDTSISHHRQEWYIEKEEEKEDDLDEGIWNVGAKEVFIFEFGVAVFWGFPMGGTEETTLLTTFRKYETSTGTGDITKSKGLGKTADDDADDDMAFLLDRSLTETLVYNDIIYLHKDSAKMRLALSYGIAQSAVLAVFEQRVEETMDAYKYIPEELASTGRVQFGEVQLGKMVGAVFVIRHDVNLYSDILDTPDFFWAEDRYEPVFKQMTAYLEIDSRVTVLNTRVDMLRDLLEVLQGQQENAHGTNLEMIVIWLIVAEVGLQVLQMLLDYLN